jgi:GTPase SAR1 family protein
MSEILNKNLQTFRSQINQIIKERHDLCLEINHEELADTVSEVRNRINEPFMFVIVGEVKAGKSSFINALLNTGKEICKVAPSPMTDTIQQVIYGEKEEEIQINEYLKKITNPEEILKEIAIVDTPGTNTIIEHHQEITERFIPAADLIVFVFEAKNPYRQSAWDFFKYIKDDWRKKILFVLQQKDLMDDDDLVINENGVRDYAIKEGIENPLVFSVSAKRELEGNHAESGFDSISKYIRDNITGGQAPLLKLTNNVEISRNINEKIQSGVNDRQKQLESDIEFRADIKETLDYQENKSKKQVGILVENLLAAYDKITLKTGKEIASGLSFFSLIRRSIVSIFNKNASAKEWLDGIAQDLETSLNEELKKRLNDGVIDIADSIQQMAKMIDLKIKNSSTILKNNHEIFSNIAERRSNVVKDLQEAFARFMNRSENFTDESLFPEKSSLASNITTGSGVAAIGVILMAVTKGAVFDITGGILTTVGVLFAGVAIGLNRRKIINGFHTEISKGRVQMDEEVTGKLNTYIQHIKDKIDANFNDFDSLLEKEEEQIKKLNDKQQSINDRLDAIKKEIN